jgi:F-type H+-transporting ATPase subunit epsilon
MAETIKAYADSSTASKADAPQKTARLSLRIITPERVVLEKEVDQVTATAIDGQLSILPQHEPIITALAIDVLHYKDGQLEETAAVLGGLMEVGENKVTVLSDTAELGGEIDETRAREAQQRAEAVKIQRTDKLDLYLSEMALSKAMARLKAAEISRARKRHHRAD